MNPSSLIYRLWAKTNERQEGFDSEEWTFHPLPLHLLDVALVAEAWLDLDGRLFERFCQLWPEASKADIRQGLILAAAVHDVGKLYPEFQAKSAAGWAHGYGKIWKGGIPNGRRFDHGAGTGKIFQTLELYHSQGALPDGIDEAWLTLAPLLRVAAGHHGTLYEEARLNWDPSVIRKRPFSDLVAPLLDELSFQFGGVPKLPKSPPPSFLLLVAGFVSVADWFGSNTDSFPAKAEVKNRAHAENYVKAHRESRTASMALRNAGLIADYEVPQDFGGLFSPPDERWNPRAGFQAAACEVDFGQNPGAELAVVEAPMGLGKTEIALHLAAKALRRGTASGIYIALPTQATSNALFKRVEQFSQRIVGDEDLALVLAHGAKKYFREYRRLRAIRRPAFGDRSVSAEHGDPNPPSEVVAPSWVQPSKRALLAPLGLGTIDQALLGAMGVKHGFVRLFGLSGKVIILDEVHAYDVYMSTLLGHLLSWLSALGTKVILLSATLPTGLRNELISAYSAAIAPASDAYPQLMHVIGDEPVDVLPDPMPETGRKVKVTLDPVEAEGESTEITGVGVNWVRSKVAQGGCVAWIRNTVREAQDAYRLLHESGIPCDLLHARFVRHDRNENEDALLQQFGPPAPKNPSRPKERVVVATQVIEQSVDVDFDVMLSDLAPVDLLLQRAGRLHRHERPEGRSGHDTPVLGVLMPASAARHSLQFGTSVYVYDAETLARSAFLVLNHSEWVLPQACRSLVADLYDRESEWWTAERMSVDPKLLELARKKLTQKRRAMESSARQTLLTAPDQFPVVRNARNDSSDAGEHVALTTRYGAHSAVVVLFRDSRDGPVPLGGRNSMTPPDDDDWRQRLHVEEAIAMASVAFPWYGSRPDKFVPPDALADIYRWWRDKHPYDNRQFIMLSDAGLFETREMTGCYDPAFGLTISKKSTQDRDSVPLEDL